MTRYRKEFIDKKIETYIYLYVKKNNCSDFYLENYLFDYIAFMLNCSKTKVRHIFNEISKKDFQTWLHNFEY